MSKIEKKMEMNFEEQLILDQWNKWADSLDDFADEETLQKFLAITGAGRKSPLAYMFIAFLGGIQAGMNFMDALNGQTINSTETSK